MKKIVTLFSLLLFAAVSFAQVTSSASASDTEKKIPRLIDFGSKQCNNCKALEPILESCRKNYADKFKTEFVDVWEPENQAFAKANQIKIIPTQIYFDAEGKELFRHTGLVSEEDILAKWAELGFPFKSPGLVTNITPDVSEDKQSLTESQ